MTVSPASPTITTTPGGTVAHRHGFTISGTKYLDLTGNGFSVRRHPAGRRDDQPLPGRTSGTPTTLVATTTTASDGTYSFTVNTPGTYYVQESVPSGYVQTGGGPNGSAGNTYYTVNAASRPQLLRV